MSESFAELFEESISNAQMKTGSILTGTVVDITGDYVIVNAGLKSEGAAVSYTHLTLPTIYSV